MADERAFPKGVRMEIRNGNEIIIPAGPDQLESIFESILCDGPSPNWCRRHYRQTNGSARVHLLLHDRIILEDRFNLPDVGGCPLSYDLKMKRLQDAGECWPLCCYLGDEIVAEVLREAISDG